MEQRLPLTFEAGEFSCVPIDCACGRHHEASFDRVIVRAGALEELPPVLADLGRRGAARNCCIVADGNTYEAAGREVETLLRADGRQITVSILGPSDGVKPDEIAAGTVLIDMPADTDLLVAVGSGCITDVTRFVAARTGTPFVSVPTAPSVDAYTSNNSPMTHRGVKRTLDAQPARAVVADTNVLAAAPAEMISSGFGDTIAKLISRIDWQLSALITGERYCPEIVRNVTEGVTRCAGLASDVGRRDPAAIATLAESLMVSGAAMALVGDSRPAAGAEHALSHYWEMKAAYDGGPPHLHGTKVGVGTVVMAAFWARFADRLASTSPGSLDTARILSGRRNAEEIRRLLVPSLGPIGDMLVKEVTQARLLGEADARSRLNTLQASWDKMAALAAEAPSAVELADQLKQAGGPAYPADIGVGADELREALFCALESRNRFTVLTAAEELGWLREIINEVVETIPGG
jgi:glycerol-1-phosphate dehydrogenase [NAD(P)+]